jgi:L-threonine-O-3-phosphate decarboxylase
MTTGHGGNIRELSQQAGRPGREILDFSANINPLGPPECVRAVISRNVEELVNYPDPAASELVAGIAKCYGVKAGQIVVGNGSSEILFAAMAAIKAPRAVIAVPSYIDYAAAARRAGVEVCNVEMKATDGFALDLGDLERELDERGTGVPPVSSSGRSGRKEAEETHGQDAHATVVIVGQPNNPTGLMFDADEFRRMVSRHAGTMFVVDEAFADFVSDCPTLMRDVPDNVIVLRSLTKFYAIPGLRLGFAVAPEDVARRIGEQLTPWSVNTLAQAVGAAVLADEEYAARSRALVKEEREFLAGELAKLPGVCVYPGVANFLLVRLDRDDIDAPALARRLIKFETPVAIRVCNNYPGLGDRFLRVAVRTREENLRLLEAMRNCGVRNADAETRRRGDAEIGRQGDGEKKQRTEAANHGRDGSTSLAEIAHGTHGQDARATSKHTPAIMFQGTSSNAGKSVLTAALCRILLQDGVRVAPFKSQNMSLNSFVTADGGEMGRAQVVQAQACRLDADVRMNPILLKPNSDTGSQVIVRGKPVGNMKVMEYVRYKPQAFAAAKECYDSLAGEFDAIVLEGAGSPGEVNLKRHDIVNMQMARYAGAPVLVVGDIDRGGVFASFVGTMEVLSAWERKLVAGWVVNRFRGDVRLLGDALDYTLSYTGRPVLGVVPYLAALNIPQEDSVDFKSGALDGGRTHSPYGRATHGQDARATRGRDGRDTGDGDACVDVAVIDLPHISNFTDFDALSAEGDVRVRIVRTLEDLGRPDAVVIPGSKNTLGDLAYLKRSGLAAELAKMARGNCTQIVGVCGGFQMLGRAIVDPQCIESAAGSDEGLGLLAVRTVLAEEKTLTRTRAMHGPSGTEVFGYEIHHGVTERIGAQTRGRGDAETRRKEEGEKRRGGETAEALQDMFVCSDGRSAGIGTGDGRVWGTYLHGVFDADEFRRWFIDRLRVRRGLAAIGKVCARYDIEPAIDRLADAVRASLDMKKIYELMGL